MAMAPEGGSDAHNQDPDKSQDLFNFKVFLVAAGILGAAFLGLTWLSSGELGLGDSNSQPDQNASVDVIDETTEESPSRLSQGEQILLATSTSPIKIRGADELAAG
nr:hypothetical protein [Leptolyngbyaceae cyanobacterium MAG.088]